MILTVAASLQAATPQPTTQAKITELQDRIDAQDKKIATLKESLDKIELNAVDVVTKVDATYRGALNSLLTIFAILGGLVCVVMPLLFQRREREAFDRYKEYLKNAVEKATEAKNSLRETQKSIITMEEALDTDRQELNKEIKRHLLLAVAELDWNIGLMLQFTPGKSLGTALLKFLRSSAKFFKANQLEDAIRSAECALRIDWEDGACVNMFRETPWTHEALDIIIEQLNVQDTKHEYTKELEDLKSRQKRINTLLAADDTPDTPDTPATATPPDDVNK